MKTDSLDGEMLAALDIGFVKSALDGIRDSIKIVDRNYNVLYANKSTISDADLTLADALKSDRKCFEKFYHNAHQCSFCVLDRVFQTGVPAFNVFHVKKGSKAEIKEISAFPLTDESGKVKCVIEILRDVTRISSSLAKSEEFSDIISADPSMDGVFEIIKLVAKTNSTVLVTGETGVGKELVTRAIHQLSKRSDRMLVAINCGAIPDTLLETELFGHEKGAFTGAIQRRIGKFELAHKGTLFLDEISSISQSMQVKILRALQEGEVTRVGGSEPVKVDVRFICAANVDLADEVKKGTFRDDLFYRINVMPINIPPLRERGDDILLLAEHYLEKFGNESGKQMQGFTISAQEQMKRYRWPGNVRELRNLVERAVILAKGRFVENMDTPGTDAIEADILSGDASLKDIVVAAERKFLIETLKNNKGNINDTAGRAGVNVRTIHRKMKELGITKEIFK